MADMRAAVQREFRAPRSHRRFREGLASVILCGPAVALYVGFMVVPAALGFAYSFTNWSGWTRTPQFIGLANFKELLGDGRLASAIRFTLFETVLIVVFFTFGSMVLAVVLDKVRIWKGLIRGLFFYPFVLSIIVTGLLVQYMTNYREGAINLCLRALHLDAFAQNWMYDPALAGYCVFGLVAWNEVGFFSTLYLANLQTIPGELYEAARIDGAGALRVFTHVQFPMLLPTVTTTSVLALITGINLFPQIVVTTQGAPGVRTFTIGYYIYDLGMHYDRQGYAAAISSVLFVALMVVTAIQVVLLRRKQVDL